MVGEGGRRLLPAAHAAPHGLVEEGAAAATETREEQEKGKRGEEADVDRCVAIEPLTKGEGGAHQALEPIRKEVGAEERDGW